MTFREGLYDLARTILGILGMIFFAALFVGLMYLRNMNWKPEPEPSAQSAPAIHQPAPHDAITTL